MDKKNITIIRINYLKAIHERQRINSKKNLSQADYDFLLVLSREISALKKLIFSN
jgi:hypothetical protein